MGAELRDSVRVQRFLFCHSGRIDAMVRGARQHPQLAKYVIDYAVGRLSYRSARARFLAKYPLVAMRMLWNNKAPLQPSTA
jgi:hypothetical protein